MKTSVTRITCFVVLLFALFDVSVAQNCAPPPIAANAKNYNIFNPEQEMILGDLTYQRMAGDLRFVRDTALAEYLQRIGNRLMQHLPPTGLKFQFLIVDIPEVNAFNIPGGYVMVSRKLIAFANNEDELAGVVAHELGHAVVRHGATDLSETFKKVLNVTEVGDRKDISEKYNLLIERRRTKSAGRSEGHENDQQLEADRIGVFAMVAAGYDADAFAGFFSRMTEAKAASGGWFSNIFGKPRPEEKRLREMIKATQQMPIACRENRQAAPAEDFLKWQASVVSAREINQKEELPALLWQRELSPRLRTDISHFAFSADGKMFLAQDDFNITVIQREPLKVILQIPTAPDARGASFSPDGKHVVYGTEGLRLEKWSIEERKPVAVRELIVRRDCWEHEYSADGNYMMCVGYDTTLTLLDTQTGKRVWEKKEFYQLSVFELITWISATAREDEESAKKKFFRIEFSPDSKYAVVTRSSSFRYRFRVDGFTAAKSEDTLIALDLANLKTVNVSGDIKKRTATPFVFLDSGKILAMSLSKSDEGGVYAFPAGNRLSRFHVAGIDLKQSENADYAIVKPLSQSKTGIISIRDGKVVAGLDKKDAALWNDILVYESTAGTILVTKVQHNDSTKMLEITDRQTLEIPVGAISNVNITEVSDNFQWLALSSKTRGAIWDLTSGARKLYVRGFRGALVADSGAGLCDFPRLEPENHALAVFKTADQSVGVYKELPDQGAQQFRQFLFTRVSLKQVDREKPDNPNDIFGPNLSEPVSLKREVRMELRNILTDKVVWTRDFPKEAPQVFFDAFSGRMILYWTLGSDAGKARLKEDPALGTKAKEMGNKDDDYLIEIFDAFAGKTVGTLLIETGKGSFDIEDGRSEGDWLVLQDTQNRFLAYSIKDSQLKHRFFGAEAALNPARNQIVVENFPGELTFYDLASGDPQGKLVFNNDAAFVRFSLDGRKLLVLTDEQKVYVFDAQRASAMQTAPN